MPAQELKARLRAAGRELLIGLSFCNLTLVPLWAAQTNHYIEPLPYGSVFLMVLTAGTVLTGVAWLVRNHWSSALAQAVGLIAFILLPLCGILVGLRLTPGSLAAFTGLSASAVRWTALAMAVGLVLIFWRNRRGLVGFCAALLLVLSPLLLYSANLAMKGDPAPLGYVHYESSRVPTTEPDPRPVYLVLMDEADYGLIFERRPTDLALPSIDRLAQTSVFFEQAYSAGRDTVLSVPAMLLGTPLRSVRPRGSMLGVTTVAGENFSDWMTEPNLLTDLSAAGHSIAVVGHYHSYCSRPTLRAQYCSHWQYLRPFRGWYFDVMPLPLAALQDHPLFKRLAQPDLEAAETRARQAYRMTFEGMFAEMPRYARGYDFVYLHLNHPHPEAFPVAVVHGKRPVVALTDYAARLRETDVYIEQLMNVIRSANGSTDFVLILTADHGLRHHSWAKMGYRIEGFEGRLTGEPADVFRVPLMVHFPSTGKALRLRTAVSTLALRELIPRLMRREISDVDDVRAFFAARPFNPAVLSTEESFASAAGVPH